MRTKFHELFAQPSYYYIHRMSIRDPWGGTNIDPRGTIWTNLEEVYWTILHAKYKTFFSEAAIDQRRIF